MINLTNLIEQVLEESNMAGGAGSAFGSGVNSTSTQFSGDNYASGDARNVLGGVNAGIITRRGLIKGKKKKKKS